jgi:hypothetical protein
MMAVDPSDDCTFWYTNQCIPADRVFNRRTRSGWFRFPGCGNATPVMTLKTNTQHPVPPVITASGPTLLTLDVAPGTFTAAVDWYWAFVYNGTLYWVTSSGVSTTPASFHAPAIVLTNVTHSTLGCLRPAASRISSSC